MICSPAIQKTCFKNLQIRQDIFLDRGIKVNFFLPIYITYASRKLTRWPQIVTSYIPLPMEAFEDEDTYKVLISWRSHVELFSDLCVAHECPIPTFIIPDERHMLRGGGTCLWRKQSEPGPSFILTTCVHAIIQYAILRGDQDVLGRDVSGWIIKYLPYSYKYFSGPRKRGLSLFIRFPNESKTSNVIIHSYTEKICIKMDPMIRFSSPCVRNNTQYTAQQSYGQFCIPQDG